MSVVGRALQLPLGRGCTTGSRGAQLRLSHSVVLRPHTLLLDIKTSVACLSGWPEECSEWNESCFVILES